MTNEPLTVASRGVTLRDFLIFQLKLGLDGLKDFVAMWLSTGAIILDVIAGRGKRPRLFYSVVRGSERFDRWLNLYSVVERMEGGDDDDGFFGASTAGDDTLRRGGGFGRATAPVTTIARGSRRSGSLHGVGNFPTSAAPVSRPGRPFLSRHPA